MKRINQNHINKPNPEANVMFIDMNSFFASCEQQVNYWLRGRPVGVCVYTGRSGCVIGLSIEAKKLGLRNIGRLDEVMKVCPQFVPLETHPQRYRQFHSRIIKVLRKYCQDVVPLSIDEAVMNFNGYQLVHKDLQEVARHIKRDIARDVGDWLKCSIGIAPNAFLAKLGTELQKPDGLVTITAQNIDAVLAKLKLTDLPGIANGMNNRLLQAGITTPLELRHAPASILRKVMGGLPGEKWHYRLNFYEVDLNTSKEYQTMQAMRQVSNAQRLKPGTLHEIFEALCMQLEKRMVKSDMYCTCFGAWVQHENGHNWKDELHTSIPLQDGKELQRFLYQRMHHFEDQHDCAPVMNTQVTAMGVYISQLVPSHLTQQNLFENNAEKARLRKAIYTLREKHGNDKVIHAVELTDEPVMKDVIGFGSVKDLSDWQSDQF